MPRVKAENKTVPLEKLPSNFRKAIVNIMSEENLDMDEAFERAAILLKPNSEEYNQKVRAEANRLYKSRYMTEMNKARKTWDDDMKLKLSQEYQKGWDQGVDWFKNEEAAFQVPCSVCGELMYFSSWEIGWDKVDNVLQNAFKNWRHADCS